MLKQDRKIKIIFAAGGTGGHLLPAQALARQLQDCEILFAGGKLSSNPFFHPLNFSFKEVKCSSPFNSHPLKAVWDIYSGLRDSRRLIKEFAPDLVVGFGSFYSFPLLEAARQKRIPYILVETNAYPGKVNRLFAPKALFSAIAFDQAAAHLNGPVQSVKVPLWSQEPDVASLSPQESRKAYQLDPDLFTLLVFGGSQGAQVINSAVVELKVVFPFQVIHLCGKDQDPQALISRYKERGIQACVKPFEETMWKAWRAADLAVCRAGAGTLSEMAHFQVPAILIPWPGASDRHQEKNAEVMESIGGALKLNQGQLKHLAEKVTLAKSFLPQMRNNLELYRNRNVEELKNTVLKAVL